MELPAGIKCKFTNNMAQPNNQQYTWGAKVVTTNPISPATCEQLNLESDFPMNTFPHMAIKASNGSVAFKISDPCFHELWKTQLKSVKRSSFFRTANK